MKTRLKLNLSWTESIVQKTVLGCYTSKIRLQVVESDKTCSESIQWFFFFLFFPYFTMNALAMPGEPPYYHTHSPRVLVRLSLACCTLFYLNSTPTLTRTVKNTLHILVEHFTNKTHLTILRVFWPVISVKHSYQHTTFSTLQRTPLRLACSLELVMTIKSPFFADVE